MLAYGLCGAATAGLRAGSIPLVVPRAHDCITLFLGSRDRYTAEFTGHPGTYWYVQEFVERSDDEGQFAGMGAVSDAEARATYQEYVAKYGEDNAAYLMEALGGWRSHYDRAAYVDMAVADPQRGGRRRGIRARRRDPSRLDLREAGRRADPGAPPGRRATGARRTSSSSSPANVSRCPTTRP